MRLLSALSIMVLCGAPGFANATIEISDTVTSLVVNRRVSYTVILPDSYSRERAQGKRFPVIYFLHCLGCDARSILDSWYCQGLTRALDSLGIIGVAPDDGNTGSWWLNSPKVANSQFSSFLATELVHRIDSLYATVPIREARGLAGHSMGGFGAMHNLLEHPGVFGIGFSIKGGLDPTYPPNPHWPSDAFGFNRLLGIAPEDMANWDRVNVIRNSYRFKGMGVAIGFYSGRQDAWFHEENQRLHYNLTYLGISHTYWVDSTEDHYSIPQNSVSRMMAFFDSSFAKVIPVKSKQKPLSAVLLSSVCDVAVFTIRGQKLRPNRGLAVPGVYFGNGTRTLLCNPRVYRKE